MSDMKSDAKQLKIEEFSLVDFVMKIQQGIRDGYEVNDTSDDAPLQIGGGFYTIMREKVEVDVELRLKAWCDKVQVRVDTEKLQEQLKAGGEIEQMLADSLTTSLVVDETTTTDDFLMVSDDIDEALSSGVVDEKLHETFIDIEKDADKWDNKELGADEAYVETIEPPKEPTLGESLPKEEQAALQTKQPTKRGKKA